VTVCVTSDCRKCTCVRSCCGSQYFRADARKENRTARRECERKRSKKFRQNFRGPAEQLLDKRANFDLRSGRIAASRTKSILPPFTDKSSVLRQPRSDRGSLGGNRREPLAIAPAMLITAKAEGSISSRSGARGLCWLACRSAKATRRPAPFPPPVVDHGRRKFRPRRTEDCRFARAGVEAGSRPQFFNDPAGRAITSPAHLAGHGFREASGSETWVKEVER